MENNNTMELNNEATVIDTADVAETMEDTVLNTDTEIIAEIDSGDTLKTVLKVLLIGGAVVTIAIAAKWDDIKKKRYEKRKKKLIEEADEYGETVFITKLTDGDEDEVVEEATEKVESVEVNEK